MIMWRLKKVVAIDAGSPGEVGGGANVVIDAIVEYGPAYEMVSSTAKL